MNFPKMESRKEAEFVTLDILIIPYSIEKEDLKALAQGERCGGNGEVPTVTH